VQAALTLDPSIVEAKATLGDIARAFNRTSEAVTDYQQAVAALPDRGDWQARLGQLLVDSGHGREAVEHLRRATILGAALNPAPAWVVQAERLLGAALRS